MEKRLRTTGLLLFCTFLGRQSSCSWEPSGILLASATLSERPRTLRGGSALRDRQEERRYTASWLLERNNVVKFEKRSRNKQQGPVNLPRLSSHYSPASLIDLLDNRPIRALKGHKMDKCPFCEDI